MIRMSKINGEYAALYREARTAAEKSYSPYSNFKVGAALLSADGKIFTGCNVENSSYGGTICAERTAFVKAISEGCRNFQAIAICGISAEKDESSACFPCGICRQFMSEFCSADFLIVLSEGEDIVGYRFEELLPHAFLLSAAEQN